MKHKFHLLMAVLISLLPLNSLRIFLYKTLFKFKIHNSKIGWLTVLNIKHLSMNNSSIGAFNLFTGPFTTTLEEKSAIGSFNYFRCGRWAVDFEQERMLVLKHHAKIENQHYFDLFGKITIGAETIIAGVRSQFWTHGSFSNEVNINIGDRCYIGSGVKFTPNSQLADDSLCAMGSVVSKRFIKTDVMVGGVPAKIIKEKINWRENWK